MARVLFGGGVADMRGKSGGAIFSANGAGAYVKSYARPPRRHTINQNAPIAALATAGYIWSNLASEDRDDWDAYAADPTEIDYDPWGNQRYLSGFQWMSRCLCRRLATEQSSLAGIPESPAQAAVTGANLTIYTPGSETCYVEWDSSQFGSDLAVILHLAVSPSPGLAVQQRNFFQVLAKYDPNDSSESIQNGIDKYFPFLQEGWTVFGRIWKQAEPGDRSTVTIISTTVLPQP